MGTVWFLVILGLCLTTVSGLEPTESIAILLEEASAPEFYSQLLEWRRELHKIPELSFAERNTSQYIQHQLQNLGIAFESGFGETGIRAGPIGPPSGPLIALRADMDGLPITEEVDVPYKSTAPGRMHACGHDAHMAMLLGAARLLQSRAASLPGRVVLLFQPAEEGLGGARAMIRDGALRDVGAVHGLHVWPALPTGTIGTRPGTIMAASDRFSFSVVGAGGHGAMPHTTRDPVVAAAAVVGALQAVVARETSPVDAAVITVARFNTGPGASNVIPDSVELSGTVRALTAPVFERLHTRLEQVAAGVAAAYGCATTNVSWSAVPYPPTRNDERMVGTVLAAARALLGEWEGKEAAGGPGGYGSGGGGRVVLVEPSLAAEDFSFYGDAVPQTAFTFLGIGDPAKATDVGLHSPRFQMDEQQMPLGAALHAAVALSWLGEQQEQQEHVDGAAGSGSDAEGETAGLEGGVSVVGGARHGEL